MNEIADNEKVAVVKAFYQSLDDEFRKDPMKNAIGVYLSPDVVYLSIQPRQ